MARADDIPFLMKINTVNPELNSVNQYKAVLTSHNEYIIVAEKKGKKGKPHVVGFIHYSFVCHVPACQPSSGALSRSQKSITDPTSSSSSQQTNYSMENEMVNSTECEVVDCTSAHSVDNGEHKQQSEDKLKMKMVLRSGRYLHQSSPSSHTKEVMDIEEEEEDGDENDENEESNVHSSSTLSSIHSRKHEDLLTADDTRLFPPQRVGYVFTVQTVNTTTHPKYCQRHTKPEDYTTTILFSLACQHAKEMGMTFVLCDVPENTVSYFAHLFGMQANPCGNNNRTPMQLQLSKFTYHQFINRSLCTDYFSSFP